MKTIFHIIFKAHNNYDFLLLTSLRFLSTASNFILSDCFCCPFGVRVCVCVCNECGDACALYRGYMCSGQRRTLGIFLSFFTLVFRERSLMSPASRLAVCGGYGCACGDAFLYIWVLGTEIQVFVLAWLACHHQGIFFDPVLKLAHPLSGQIFGSPEITNLKMICWFSIPQY